MLPTHCPAAADFDSALRSAFSSLTGLHLDGSQWAQAARGFGQAGLGLRSVLADAPAAYLASVGGCADLCAAVEPGFDTSLLSGRADVLAALAGSNTAGTAGNAAWEHQLATSIISACAVLRSEAEEGARAFLAAVPVIADAADDAWCPRCDAILDRFSLHAGVCSLRRHTLRDVLFTWKPLPGLPGPLHAWPLRPSWLDSPLSSRLPSCPCFLGWP